MTTKPLEVQRVRHPIAVRMLRVKRVAMLSASMRRITLAGDDLAGFVSASFDDHLKLMLPPAPGEKPAVPTPGPNGLVFDEGKPRPAMRDYTPRRYDPVAGELDIDFVLHHAGPATDWASQAEPGQYVAIGGPRGSFVVPTGYDWHLLAGDETAIPAIARRLEELPAQAKAIVFIAIKTEGARLALPSACQLQLHWVLDAAPGALASAVRGISLPAGEGYAWAAGEYSEIKAVREVLVDVLGMDKSRIRASSYWRKAAANTHETFVD